MISLNDTPEVREIFGRYPMASVSLTYTIRGGEGKAVGEVVILDGKEPGITNLPLL